MLVCGNALGEFMPPFILYKGSDTSLELGWASNGAPDMAYKTTKKGWMDQISFKAWLVWFDQNLEKKGIEKPVVLFMDGSSTH